MSDVFLGWGFPPTADEATIISSCETLNCGSVCRIEFGIISKQCAYKCQSVVGQRGVVDAREVAKSYIGPNGRPEIAQSLNELTVPPVVLSGITTKWH